MVHCGSRWSSMRVGWISPSSGLMLVVPLAHLSMEKIRVLYIALGRWRATFRWGIIKGRGSNQSV